MTDFPIRRPRFAAKQCELLLVTLYDADYYDGLVSMYAEYLCRK